MGMNGLLMPAWLWITDLSVRIMPEYIIPNLTIILQITLILVLAYIAGKLGKFLTKRFLIIVELKRLTEKSWAEGVLRVTGYKGSIVGLIADLVKWLIYIVFFIFILKTVGLSQVADTLSQIAIFMPRFIGAILLIVVGFIIADFLGKVFGEAGSKTLGGEGMGQLAGGLVRYTIGIIVLIMSLALMGIGIVAMAILLSALLVMVIIIAGLGLKDTMPEISAGIHNKNNYKVGDRIRVSGYSGVIHDITPINTTIKTAKGLAVLPNTVLMKNIVLRGKSRK